LTPHFSSKHHHHEFPEVDGFNPKSVKCKFCDVLLVYISPMRRVNEEVQGMSEDTHINPYYARIKELEQEISRLSKDNKQLRENCYGHCKDIAHENQNLKSQLQKYKEKYGELKDE
jgi:outer membrane murein-binding lipoprotein Lpp